MNRRKCLEALAGIPLLGLLVRLSSTEEVLDVTALQGALADIRDSAQAAVPSLRGLAAAVRDARDSFYTTSSNTTNGPTMTYWDGQEWISMKVEYPWSWRTKLA